MDAFLQICWQFLGQKTPKLVPLLGIGAVLHWDLLSRYVLFAGVG